MGLPLPGYVLLETKDGGPEGTADASRGWANWEAVLACGRAWDEIGIHPQHRA